MEVTHSEARRELKRYAIRRALVSLVFWPLVILAAALVAFLSAMHDALYPWSYLAGLALMLLAGSAFWRTAFAPWPEASEFRRRAASRAKRPTPDQA